MANVICSIMFTNNLIENNGWQFTPSLIVSAFVHGVFADDLLRNSKWIFYSTFMSFVCFNVNHHQVKVPCKIKMIISLIIFSVTKKFMCYILLYTFFALSITNVSLKQDSQGKTKLFTFQTKSKKKKMFILTVNSNSEWLAY